MMKIEHLPIGRVKLNPDNPRQISNKDFQSLVKSLQDCPDMFEARPLLCSDRTGKLIVLGGNMRLRAAQKLGYKEVPVIILPGLTEVQEQEITIKDNGAWGQWDFDALANAWSDLPLKDWGVAGIPEQIDLLEDGEEIEIPQSVQIEPPKEYILILCEPNSVEWEELKEKLKLKMVRRGGYHRGSAFDAVALERVLFYNDFKKRIKNAYRNSK